MKKNVLMILLAVLIPISLNAKDTPVYSLDQSHSSVGFSVKHMLVSNVLGQFDAFESRIQWDKTDLKNSAFEGSAKVASINTKNKKRDKHLRSDDFFDSEKYPSIRFRSKKITKVDGYYQVTGDFTMKDVTKQITVPVQVYGPINDGYGNQRIGIESEFTINRQDYNVNWSKKMDNGGLVVDDKVKIMINIEGIRKGA